MLRKGQIPIIIIAGIVLAVLFVAWAIRSLGGNPESDLMQAAFDNDILMLEAIVNSGGDLNAVTGDGWNAAMYAASGKSKDALKFLIKNGVDINARNNEGKTALTIAKEGGFEEIIQILEDEGGIE